MDTGHHRGGVQPAAEGAADAEGQGNQPLHGGEHAAFQPAEHRADNGQGEITGDNDGDQRGDEQIDHFRHDLVEPLFQEAHKPHRNHHRDHVALVTYQVDVIQTEPGFRCRYGLGGGHAPGVEQIRVNHNHADDCP